MIYLFVSSVLSFLMGLGLGLMTRKYLSLVPLFLMGGVLGVIIGISYVKTPPLPASVGNLWDLLAVRPLLPHILVLSLTGALIGGAIGAYMGKKGAK